MTFAKYDLIRLETFTSNLGSFNKTAIKKINKKIEYMLTSYPTRFPMLESKIKVCGARLSGLRHMKVGIEGVRGGAYVLYRICEECIKNKYYEENRLKCQFCDENKLNRVVLFDTHIRSFDYKR